MRYPSLDFQDLELSLQNLRGALRKEQPDVSIFTFVRTQSGGSGRPKLQVSKEQLSFYLEHNFTTPQISEMLAISESTIKRRMREFELQHKMNYSELTDEQLDDKVIGTLD